MSDLNIKIRDFENSDFETLFALNQSASPEVSGLTLEEMRVLITQACYLKVAEVNNEKAGFLLAVGPGEAYKSLNYQWFSERYDNFTYIDRVIVAVKYRGKGVGKALYSDIENFAAKGSGLLTCEVNLFPPNPDSLAFHRKFGFYEAGQQNTEGGKKRVSLLIKPLNAEIKASSCGKAD